MRVVGNVHRESDSKSSPAGNGLRVREELVTTRVDQDPKNGLKPRSFGHSMTLIIGWWNGGGGILKRLEVNPGLKQFLNSKPDIFAYGESLITSSQGLSLEGYNFSS